MSVIEHTIDARYDVLARLGEGGIGTVFLVADRRREDARLALKLIPRDHLGGVSLRYFRDEFRTLARLRHPNITEVFDFGATPDGGHFYYTAEFVDGVDLVQATEACRAPGTEDEVARAFARLYDLVAQTARALDHVHAHGYVHFDVKPANILVKRSSARDAGVVKLLDFGLSSERTSVRRPGLRGTLPYMPPEVIRGDPVDRRADLYSLGATLYEAVTGRPPFGGSTADVADVERGHLRDEPAPPRERNARVPAPLEKVILRLLRKDPAHRFATAEEVVRAMRLFGGLPPRLAEPPPGPARPLRPSFVGREDERRALAEDVRAIERGAGPRVVVIEGEVGSGKSRLLRETSHRAQLAGIPSALVDPGLEPTPAALAASITWSLSLAGHPERSSGDEREPAALAERLAARVARAARARPFALFLDGVERADLDLAAFLARLTTSLALRHGSRRTLIVLATRAGGLPPPLATALDEVSARRVALGPLSTREIESLLQSALGRSPGEGAPEERRQAQLVEAEVGGNPLRVERLLAALADHGAVTVLDGRFHLDASLLEKPGARPWTSDLFGGALADLAPDAARLARRLAALERPVDALLLERAAGLDEARFADALDALRRADVVRVLSGRGKRERIGFRHEAVARATRAATGTDEARAANDAVVSVLERRAGRLLRSGAEVPLAIVDRIAHHALRGSDRPAGLRAALAAAERMEEALSRARAAELYAAALEVTPLDDTPTRVRILERIGLQDEYAGRTAAARERYVAALAAAERLPECPLTAVVQGRLLIRQATALEILSDTAGARRSLHRALQTLPKQASALRSEALVRLGWQAFRPPRGRAAAAIRLVRRARMGLGRPAGDTPTAPAETSEDRDKALLRIENALGAFHDARGELRVALRHHRAALRVARQSGNLVQTAFAYGNIGRIVTRQRRFVAAGHIMKAALRYARRAGLANLEAATLTNLGTLEWARGKHRRAGRHFEAAAAICRTTGNIDMGTQAVSNVAYALERRGEYAEALARHDGAAEQARRSGRRTAEIAAQIGVASASLLAGDTAGATRALDAADALLSKAGTPTLRAEALEVRARLLRDRGRASEALAAADEAHNLRGDLAPALDASIAALERAELMLSVRDPATARLAWSEASARAKELHSPHLRALAAFVRGQIALSEGKPHLAVRALHRAATTFPEREDVDLAWRASRMLALALVKTEEPGLAEAHFERAARIVREVDDRLSPELSEMFRRREGVRELIARTAPKPQAREPRGTESEPVASEGRYPEAYAPEPRAAAQTRAPIDAPPPPVTRRADAARAAAATRADMGELAETIIQMNRDLAGERDRKRLMERLLDAAVRLSGAERGYIMLASKKAPTGLKFMAGRNLQKQDIGAKNAYSATIVRHVVDTGRTVVLADARVDARFRGSASVIDLGISSVLCAPLSSKERTVGAIYLDHRFRTAVFGPVEQRALAALADQATIALENGRLLRTAERARAEVEELAKRLEVRVESQDREPAIRRTLTDVQGDPELARRYGALVGSSPPMVAMFRLLDKIAPSDLSVLIQGESGTGKELVARALHLNSLRKLRPLVGENCGAIPDNLLEAELFGAKKGAFTGAHTDRQGLFETAHGGTLFLDEVGDMSLAMQTKLLRVLQCGEVRPLGSTRPVRVDVRVVAATNKDLRAEVDAGRFREDLFYRLNGVLVTTPALRDRPDDIPLLVDRFLDVIAQRVKAPKKTLGHAILDALAAYGWPGNVRELQHEVERAAQLSGASIELDALSPQVRGAVVEELSLREIGPRSLDIARKSSERRVLLAALARVGNNRTKAAELLGISRYGLQKMLLRCKIP